MAGLSNVNCPCESLLVFATGCIPPCNCIRITSTDAAGLPVVAFVTLPCNVAACAEPQAEAHRAPSTHNRRTENFIDCPLRKKPFSARADASSAIPSPDRFPPAPALLPFQATSSLLRNHLLNIFPRDIQTAGRGYCRKSCRAVPITDPTWCGEAPGQTRRAE